MGKEEDRIIGDPVEDQVEGEPGENCEVFYSGDRVDRLVKIIAIRSIKIFTIMITITFFCFLIANLR